MRMKSPEIYVTIGPWCTDQLPDTIESLLEKGIHCFRFNMAKYGKGDQIEERCRQISTIKASFDGQIRIMVDVPFPGEKVRIFMEHSPILLSQRERLFIQSGRGSPKINGKLLYTNCPNIGKYVRLGERFVYGDCKNTFVVTKILDIDLIEVTSLLSGQISSGKSISFGKVLYSDEINNNWLRCINDMEPDLLALSFVNNVETVRRYQKRFHSAIISKIENENGVRNINEISSASDIMIARGDLMLNMDICDFHLLQNKIAEAAHNHHKRLFVATGILSSLAERNMPTQAEINDLAFLMKLGLDGIVLNYGVVGGYLENALHIINHLKY
ncbi:MAG: pyruvate kinase [Acutalibacteraceae bacterium]